MDAIPLFRWLCPAPPPAPVPPSLRLQHLPDDLLARIFIALMNPVQVGSHARIVEQSYVAALPLSLTSTKFHAIFHRLLTDCELWQSATFDDLGLSAIARNANRHIQRLILRKCSRISATGLRFVAAHCTNIRTLDLSYLHILDDHLHVVLSGVSSTLRSLLIRGCHHLTDASLRHIAQSCTVLEALDMCALPHVTDQAMEFLAKFLRKRLIMLLFSECPQITDRTLVHLGKWCPCLEVVTCRRLNAITNQGIHALCKGLAQNLAILDILDCHNINVHRFLESARTYCPQLARRYECAEGKSLRQVIISSLSAFIFHVTGSDIHNGKAAVYFLLVDSGTSNSFRVSIGSSSLDLTHYGSILASCFGESPNDHVKQTLSTLYGLDLHAEDSSANREV